jgi:membrane-associated protein
MDTLIDLFLHLDVHLAAFVDSYGVWVYGLLFAVIFAETGLVVTPFLPGDSLLFAAGALAATGALDAGLVSTLIAVGAISGNAVNYTIGRLVGPHIFTATDRQSLAHRLLNRKHLERAHEFFEKHGGMAVVLSRFVPIVRTFVPFVAGAATMSASMFLTYNVAGGLAWTALCVGTGYLFGNVPIVKNNFSLVAIGIVFVSVLPMVVEVWRQRRESVSGS